MGTFILDLSGKTELPDKIDLSWSEVSIRATKIANQLVPIKPKSACKCGKCCIKKPHIQIYPIPRGGVPAALAVCQATAFLGVATSLVEDPRSADVYVDDIIDSGTTRLSTFEQYGEKPFFALVDKLDGDPSVWHSFPWERMGKEDGPLDNVRRLLQYIGEDTDREGLLRTPDRVVKSYDYLFSGYKADPAKEMTVFVEDSSDEMVVVHDIEFYSCCEHHMLPFFGKAHIAYIPDGKVIGVSKLVRVLEIFSRRLQIQERLCSQVTSALMEHLKPKGAACVLQAQHLCMLARGVQKQNSVMTTSSLEGVFRKPEVRAEFLSVIQHG